MAALDAPYPNWRTSAETTAWSATNRPSNHITSTLRPASRSSRRLHPVEIAIDVELQEGRRMIGRPSCRRQFDPAKAQFGNIQCIDEGVDHANRIALVDPVIEAFRQQRQLRPIHPRYEARHPCPHRINVES